MRSEPHKVTAPPEYYPHAEVDGVVHVAWREIGKHRQMSCGLEVEPANMEYYEKKPLPPVTCIWCVVGVLPWLHWNMGEIHG